MLNISKLFLNIPWLNNYFNKMKEQFRFIKLQKDKKYKDLKQQALNRMESLSYIEHYIDMYSAQASKKYDFLEAAISDDLICCVKKWETCKDNEPISICVVKNDLQRIRIQYDHLKRIGIRNMIYIDNLSTDGTYEWLEEQDYINVYKVKSNYNSFRRNAWIRKLTDIYGYDRWYLIMDSDELFIYPMYEKYNIEELVQLLERNNQRSISAMMLDMYRKDQILITDQLSDDEIINEYVWFDTEGYKKSIRHDCLYLEGGPRERVFFSDETHKPILTKYPLVKLQRNDLYLYHEVRTTLKDMDKKFHSVLLHYKFLPQDNKRYEEIVAKENYANGSFEYKKYLQILTKNKFISFYNDKSCKLRNSIDIGKIKGFDRELYKDWMKSN